MARQRRAIGGDERRAGEQAEVHREEIVPEARQRRLARLHRAAGDAVALEHADLPAFGGQMNRGGQSVVPRPDDDRVVRHNPSRTAASPRPIAIVIGL